MKSALLKQSNLFESLNFRYFGPVDGHDAVAVDAALVQAHDQAQGPAGRPTLIICRTTIGKGAPTKAGGHDVHGAPLGATELAAFKAAIGWNAAPFEVPAELRAAWDCRERGAARQAEWQGRMQAYRVEHPGLAYELMRRLAGEPLHTFSIGVDRAEDDESAIAAETARRLGTVHHELRMDALRFEDLAELPALYDEPFAETSALGVRALSRAAREHVKVVLTGDGGDEVFGGYESNLFERWARMYRILPRSVDQLLRWSAERVDAHVDTWEGRLRSRDPAKN